jgi:carbon starvation protein
MVAVPSEITGLKPGTIYGNGIGTFLTILIGEDNLPFAITFGAMAFSTFVFDTLDVCTRLGRYLLQELFGWRSRWGAVVATLLTISVPSYFLLLAPEGAWVRFWTLFGSSNQLLAALSLLTITIWLYRSRKRIWFTLFPMLFVLTITLWSLVTMAISHARASSGFDIDFLNAVGGCGLVVLALYLVVEGIRKGRAERIERVTAEVSI